MVPAQILAWLFIAVIAFLIFWIPAVMLHKAGFSRWFALLIPFTGFVGLAVFALIEWPIERELAWLRWKSGEFPDDAIDVIERYAIKFERRGDWKKAAEVCSELSQKLPHGENAEYYRNCVARLKEHLDV
jgi:hypothetical protein